MTGFFVSWLKSLVAFSVVPVVPVVPVVADKDLIGIAVEHLLPGSSSVRYVRSLYFGTGLGSRRRYNHRHRDPSRIWVRIRF